MTELEAIGTMIGGELAYRLAACRGDYDNLKSPDGSLMLDASRDTAEIASAKIVKLIDEAFERYA